jgi:hypothetical protein
MIADFLGVTVGLPSKAPHMLTHGLVVLFDIGG